MSTNHTTNYDLNQWEGTDKVLRTEFNADNSKIDAALKANADAIAAEAAAREAGERWVKLFDQTVAQATDNVAIDLSETEVLDFLDLRLWIEAAQGKELCVRVNGANWNYYRLDGYTTLYSPIYADTFLCTVNRDSSAAPSCVQFYPPMAGVKVSARVERFSTSSEMLQANIQHGQSTVTWDQLTSIQILASSGQVPAGTKVCLMGLKR